MRHAHDNDMQANICNAFHMQSSAWRCNARILTIFYLWCCSPYLSMISCNHVIAHLFDVAVHNRLRLALILSLLVVLMLQSVTVCKFWSAVTFLLLTFDLDWLDSDDAMCWLYHLLDFPFLRDHHLLLPLTHHLYSSCFSPFLFTFAWISNLLS